MKELWLLEENMYLLGNPCTVVDNSPVLMSGCLSLSRRLFGSSPSEPLLSLVTVLVAIVF